MGHDAVLARCGACGAKNRIPVQRVGQSGKCGRCRGELPAGDFFATAPVAIPEAKFDALTRLSPQPVLIDFWAEWCAPCRQLAPVLEQLAAQWSGKLLVGKVDTEAAPTTAARFGVRSIPTLVLLRSGIEVDRMVGALPLPALQERLSRYVDLS